MMQKCCLPIYMQIVEDLKKYISGKQWAPGTLLPTEFELAKQYGVSRPTLRNAMAFLEKEGYIIRKKFSGTVVAPEALRQKYKKLDISFFTRTDLTRPDAYVHLFHEPLQMGHVLRRGVRQGYFVRFFPWQYPPTTPSYYDLDEVLFHKGADAFIVSSPLYLTEILDRIRENRVPHVALESHYDKPGVNTVMLDDEVSMKEEIRILYELGHRKIGFLGGILKLPELNSQNRRFYHLFLTLIKQYGLEMHDHWIQVSGEDQWRNLPAELIPMSSAMLKNPACRPTAVICGVGKCVSVLQEVARGYGLEVPKHLSVMSPLTYSGDVPDFSLSGHYPDMERHSERVYQEILAWLKNPAYRPACHYVLKDYHPGKTIASPTQIKGGKN